MVGDISIWWNSTYDMVLRAMRLRIPLRNWLDEQVLMEPGLDRLALLTLDWKKLKYLIILLRPFAEYTSLIRNTRDATINHTWNVYNVLFDHLDIIQDQFRYKDLEKNPWISEFITAVEIGTVKLKEYYSKTGGPVEMCRAVSCSSQVTRGPTGVVSPNSGSINRSSGLRYGGPIRESEFGPKVWRSGLGTGVVGLRPGGAQFGRYDSSGRSLL